ncbi:hypothetical protein H0H92_007039 [Tricholoma furcatifolium]|nr:hypothetical protein H0H92_007039 [Tricholoma furcatifolium]
MSLTLNPEIQPPMSSPPSPSRGIPRFCPNNPTRVLPNALMRFCLPDYLWDAASVAVTIAYFAQHVEINMTALTRLADNACAFVYVLMFTDRQLSGTVADLRGLLDDICACFIRYISDNMISRALGARKLERRARELEERLDGVVRRAGFDLYASIQDYFIEYHRNQQMVDSAFNRNPPPTNTLPARAAPHSSNQFFPTEGRPLNRDSYPRPAVPPHVSLVNSPGSNITYNAPQTHNSGNTRTDSKVTSQNNMNNTADQTSSTQMSN